MSSTDCKAKWTELLESAVTQPGIVSEAYSRFHNYSMGNQMLAMWQCSARGIKPGPIGTFMMWKDAGRFVRKGERAIQLCMPVTHKRKDTDDAGNEIDAVFTSFIYKNNWFVLSQTDGADYVAPDIPTWSDTAALAKLGITRVEFDATDGNCQGYARAREIAVSPVAALPHKTLFHELAHVVLGHTTEGLLNDGAEITPRDIRELEAESVALLCCESLGLPGAEYSRGYIQNWYRGQSIPERSAQRIFHAADQILKAGVPA